ncbi:hypothetical protein [Nannocystis sp. SCPEA4]|uniref:hypothetical protein n=1 Tax=Nannocystis sp. SCPEA4 TaxID=2996787 RepID=UPI002270C410|nr:hypothetical protein [Nannocystis sp. SCPEA4]MCY1059748.1 hypothetical protein [Nannocystis sp. SCPEA4]
MVHGRQRELLLAGHAAEVGLLGVEDPGGAELEQRGSEVDVTVEGEARQLEVDRDRLGGVEPALQLGGADALLHRLEAVALRREEDDHAVLAALVGDLEHADLAGQAEGEAQALHGVHHRHRSPVLDAVEHLLGGGGGVEGLLPVGLEVSGVGGEKARGGGERVRGHDLVDVVAGPIAHPAVDPIARGREVAGGEVERLERRGEHGARLVDELGLERELLLAEQPAGGVERDVAVGVGPAREHAGEGGVQAVGGRVDVQHLRQLLGRGAAAAGVHLGQRDGDAHAGDEQVAGLLGELALEVDGQLVDAADDHGLELGRDARRRRRGLGGLDRFDRGGSRRGFFGGGRRRRGRCTDGRVRRRLGLRRGVATGEREADDEDARDSLRHHPDILPQNAAHERACGEAPALSGAAEDNGNTQHSPARPRCARGG